MDNKTPKHWKYYEYEPEDEEYELELEPIPLEEILSGIQQLREEGVSEEMIQQYCDLIFRNN